MSDNIDTDWLPGARGPCFAQIWPPSRSELSLMCRYVAVSLTSLFAAFVVLALHRSPFPPQSYFLRLCPGVVFLCAHQVFVLNVVLHQAGGFECELVMLWWC